MGDVTNRSPSPQRQVGVLRVDYDKNCDRFRVLPSCYPRSHYSVRVVRVTLLKAAAIGTETPKRAEAELNPSAAGMVKTGFSTQSYREEVARGRFPPNSLQRILTADKPG